MLLTVQEDYDAGYAGQLLVALFSYLKQQCILSAVLKALDELTNWKTLALQPGWLLNNLIIFIGNSAQYRLV